MLLPVFLLVSAIRPPGEDFCYVKQSFDDERMELIFDGDTVTVVTPHIRSARWDVTYWVDTGERRSVPHEAIMSPNSVRLPAEMIGELEAGNYLNVRVSPLDAESFLQSISLLGFTAASRKLDDPECTGSLPAADDEPSGQADATATGG